VTAAGVQAVGFPAMLNHKPGTSSFRLLDPYDRTSEVLFGLIMVLTFTGSLSVAQAGREDIRAMLVGALGCNLAWGVIDAVFYVMGSLAERGKARLTTLAVRDSDDPAVARGLIAEALPPVLVPVVRPDDLDTMCRRIKGLPEAPPRVGVCREDWRGAVAVFLLVFLSTLPVVIPFIVMQNVWRAMRWSNAIAIAMLFATGVVYGRSAGHRPWLTGLLMVVLGGFLVGLTVALGG
jgi:hypothetical protein